MQNGKERIPNERDRTGGNTKAPNPKEKSPKEKIPKGKTRKEKIAKAKRFGQRRWYGGGKSESSQRGKGAAIHYSPNATRGKNWAHTSTRNERQYREYISSWVDWEYQDGAWREIREPTEAEIDVIDGSAKTVEFGEHANKTYGEVLTNKPHYLLYQMKEDQRNHYEAKKPTKRIARQKIENAWKVGSVWILDNFREKSRSGNSRGMLSMSNSIELVVRIRSAVRNVFIFKPTLVRFG